MQHPYSFIQLLPISTYIAGDGDVNAIYDLPAPKDWQFVRFDYDPVTESVGNRQEEFHQVTRVRVSLGIDELVPGLRRPFAVVIPFYQGKEDLDGAKSFSGVRSYIGVLDYLGFTPILIRN